ncbi:MAG: hypothetical protein A2W99_12450 [Bacteroidetes bacterium GWF2_33_16]|nr:MAG: hypothetical protein A2X00_01825 [Bacteroidetes bacterium GWE2_32_14]OFY06503.1 MAG: hypothetical protein A2W99_12450 [Bacteroidetes bacterium GWF2_33_16]
MLLKRHYIQIWLRVIGILITCIIIAFVSVSKPDWFYLINLFVILGVQVYLLVRSQNTISRELEQLFDSINCADTTTNFVGKTKNNQFKNFHSKLNRVLEQIKELKVDSLQQNEYLTTLFEHINIGIISLTKDGLIQMKNSSAKKIIGRGGLENINDLRSIDNAFAKAIEEIKPDESKLISIYRDGYLQHLTIRAALLKFPKEEIKIVSFQNIRGELDEREMEGWQKLIRVLTHELMNSAGPINSTISTLLEILNENTQPTGSVVEISPEIIADTIKGLKIIEERSKGMIDFVKRFRSLTLIPHPTLMQIDVDDLINNILVLLHDEAVQTGVELNYKTRFSNLKAIADKAMLEQILINLIKNSFEAIKNKKKSTIGISVWSDHNSAIYIDISDNGGGIPQDIQDKIFVPFFTTRKEGTGIGLSLSRQLANVQGGALALTKSTPEETIFTLKIKSAK